jgi:hypothetical protein
VAAWSSRHSGSGCGSIGPETDDRFFCRLANLV